SFPHGAAREPRCRGPQWQVCGAHPPAACDHEHRDDDPERACSGARDRRSRDRLESRRHREQDGRMSDSRLRRWGRAELRSPRPLLVILIVVLFGIFATLKPMFLNGPFSIAPLITTISIFTVVGLSQMMALSVGHMNLAVGQLAGISSLVMGACFENLKLPLLPGLLVGLVVGAALGGLAGWIIAKTGVNSFIVTLAMNFTLL